MNTDTSRKDSALVTEDSALVTEVFPDRNAAERAWHSATARGYQSEDLNVVMTDDTRKRYFTQEGTLVTELGSKAAGGAGTGAAVGGTLGAIAAAIAAVGTSIVLPGLGLVIAGPLAAAIAGAGAGGAAGSLVGALIGWGIPEERVKQHEGDLANGGILMGVTPRSSEDAEYFRKEWSRSGQPNEAQARAHATASLT